MFNTHFSMNLPSYKTPLKAALLASLAALSACNDQDALRVEDEHDHETVSTGRLVIGKADGANSKVIVHDLADNKTVGALNLSYEPTALYSSPEHRYAVVVQANNAAVNFVDGGIFQHDDHVDTQTPALLSFALSGVKPAHYRDHDGLAALFYDGEGTNNAKIDVFSDESLERGALEAAQSLPAPVHGIAEARGDYLISIDYTAAENAVAAVRTAVRLHERHGDHYHAEQRFTTPCLNLHGGSSNEDFSAFGCTDGVLVIQQADNVFTDFKIPTPKRITQVAGHHDVAKFAAFAADGTLYVIDPIAKTATEVNWAGGATTSAGVAVNRLLQDYDGHAEHLLILDNAGTLHVLKAADLSRKGSVKVLSSIATGNLAPKLAVSAAEDRAFITDAADKSIVVIDLEAQDVVDHVDLDFAPVGLTWVGAAASNHAH